MNNVAKLADFGSAKFLSSGQTTSQAHKATKGDMMHTVATGTPLWYVSLLIAFL